MNEEKTIIEKLGVTPGPWEDSEGMGYIFANRVGGCSMSMQRMTVANTRGYGCLQYHGEEKCRAEMGANENLISLAPELLEALDSFISIIDSRKPGESSKPLTENEILKLVITTEKSIQLIERKFSKSWEEIKGDN